MSTVATYLSNTQPSQLAGEYQQDILEARTKGKDGLDAVLFSLMARLTNEPSNDAEFVHFERVPREGWLAYNNYIQTFSKTYEQKEQLLALGQILNDIELSYLLGTQAKIERPDGTTIYTAGGIYNALIKAGLSSTHILDGNGDAGVPIGELINWTKNVLPNGSATKLLLAGTAAYSAISSLAEAGTEYKFGDIHRAFGLQIQTIYTPFGEIGLAKHPLYLLQDKAILVDLEFITQKVKVPLIRKHILTANDDAVDVKEGFYAELALKVTYPDAFGVLTNFRKVIV